MLIALICVYIVRCKKERGGHTNPQCRAIGPKRVLSQEYSLACIFPMVYWIGIHAAIFFIFVVNMHLFILSILILILFQVLFFNRPECPNPPILVNQHCVVGKKTPL